MSPRQKKPPVKPEKRLEWLDRVENGESAPKIAKTDRVDARTVRKHVEIARQEKETKEARASVLRNALERHYADLCRYAESLAGSSPRGTVSYSVLDFPLAETPTVYTEQLAIALRQHLPRSHIWSYLSQIPKLYALKAEIIKKLDSKIEVEIASDSRLSTELSAQDVIPDLVTTLKAQFNLWMDGLAGLNVEDNLKPEPAENGLVNLRYGPYSLGKVKEEHVAFVGAVVTDWTARVKEWQEYRELEKVVRDIQRVERNLHDEVAVIALRRVVPGRCRYCPI
jgi:hypothetical protein